MRTTKNREGMLIQFLKEHVLFSVFDRTGRLFYSAIRPALIEQSGEAEWPEWDELSSNKRRELCRRALVEAGL